METSELQESHGTLDHQEEKGKKIETFGQNQILQTSFLSPGVFFRNDSSVRMLLEWLLPGLVASVTFVLLVFVAKNFVSPSFYVVL